MGRPPVPNLIEITIAQLHEQYPKWKAPTIRNRLVCIFKDNPDYANKVPGNSTIQKRVKAIEDEKNTTPPNPLEQPWSIGALAEYPYLQNILPALLALREHEYDTPHGSMSIRIALWYYRLSPLITKAAADSDKEDVTEKYLPFIQDWYFLAITYSNYERVWQDVGKLPLPSNTSVFDGPDIETIKKNILEWYRHVLTPSTYEKLVEISNADYATWLKSERSD